MIDLRHTIHGAIVLTVTLGEGQIAHVIRTHSEPIPHAACVVCEVYTPLDSETLRIEPDAYPFYIDAVAVPAIDQPVQRWTVYWWGDLYPDGNPAGITDLLAYMDGWEDNGRDIRDLLNYLSEWYAWGGDSQTAARAVRGAME